MSNQLTWPMVIDECAPKFNEIANANKLVTWAEESQFAGQAIAKNDKLSMCTPDTVKDSIINVAAIGLTLNPALGFAYLVPESQKIGNDWVNQCTLKISFKGLLKIANDSGSVLWVKAEIVRDQDTFIYKGPCDMPKHEFNPFSGDRGPTVGVYCVAKTFEGDYLVDIMDLAEINKIKDCAKTKGVWDKWLDEMAKKAIIKRASKQWPRKDQSNRLETAVAILNEAEGSEQLERDITPKVNPELIGKYHGLISSKDGVGMFYFIDELKSITKYSSENFEDYTKAITEIQATIPRGQKGIIKALQDELFKDGLNEVVEAIQSAISNEDDQGLVEYLDEIKASKSMLKPFLNSEEIEYLTNRSRKH